MKNLKEVEKGGLKFPNSTVKLTPVESSILDMLTKEFMTIKQIQCRRKCSLQAVYKIIKKLKGKGALNNSKNKGLNFDSSIQPNRLHGQEFNINILFQSENYQNLLKKSNIFYLDGHTIRLYNNSLEIYSGKGVSFFGEDEQRATAKSLEYWNKFFTKLENELKIVFIKPRARNIKIVNQHYAYTNSEICENAINNGKIIRVYACEDGKLAFITDDSFNLKEDETVHPLTAKQDRKAINKQVNDWRINNPPTNSELSEHIMNLTNNIDYFGKHMVSHVKAIQDLSRGVNKLNKLVGNVVKENKKLKLGDQKTLLSY